MSMSNIKSPARAVKLAGQMDFPGDKSIAHRAVILAAIAEGVSIIDNLPDGQDLMSTQRIMQNLGAKIEKISPRSIRVIGNGGRLTTPPSPLDCGNSATSMRLLCGLLAGADMEATLIGDSSLSSRPMNRVAEPLGLMGAKILTTDGRPPVEIKKRRRPLKGISYRTKIPSAQVKSAILLAALFAEGESVVAESFASRDHTERLFEYLDIPVKNSRLSTLIKGPARVRPFTLTIPGDPSSAAYFAAASIINPGMEVRLQNILYNPKRLGFFRAAGKMGAGISYAATAPCGPENTATIAVKSSKLEGIEISGQLALDAIDELPLLAAMALFANGGTTIRDAGELRKKESDRIASTTGLIRSLGGEIEELDDGWRIDGPQSLRANVIDPAGDHRIAMTAATISTIVEGVKIIDPDIVNVSYPGFFNEMRRCFDKALI